MPVLGRTDSGSALSDTSALEDARRFDATRGGHVIDAHGHTRVERRAAISLGVGAHDKAEFVEFLQMCGLLPDATH